MDCLADLVKLQLALTHHDAQTTVDASDSVARTLGGAAMGCKLCAAQSLALDR